MPRNRAGRVLNDRYRLEHPLRRGRIGQVWEASDVGDPPNRVAVEILAGFPRSQSARERYGHSATRAVWPWFSHPNAVRTIRYGQDAVTRYAVTELVEGETVAERLDRMGPLPPSQAARIAERIADCLVAAHREGIVHGDLRPELVLLTPDGG